MKGGEPFVGGQIKKLRLEKKLTQKEFAEKIKVSRSYLSEVENGRKSPSRQVLDDIIKAFKLPKYYFDQSDKIKPISSEIKISKTKQIEHKVISDMKSLNIYKLEYNAVVKVFSETVFQYRLLMDRYEKLDYPTETYEGKKPPIVAQIETLRKDIASYSDRLMLNPKSYQAIADAQEPPKSKLAEALAMFE